MASASAISSCCAGNHSWAGPIRTASMRSVVRCVSGSKRRIDSISFPNSSMRTGNRFRRRVGVEQAAATRRLSGALDQRAELVAGCDEPRRERVDAQPVADRHATARAEVRRPRGRAAHRRHGGHDQRRRYVAAGLRELCEGHESAARHVRRRLLARVRQAGPGRERQRGVPDPRAQRLERRVGVDLAGHDQQRGRAQPVPEVRGDGGLGGVGHA